MKKIFFIYSIPVFLLLIFSGRVYAGSSIGTNINYGAAYPDGTVSKDYSRTWAPAYSAGFTYAYQLNEYFSLRSGLNYEYRPIPLHYEFPKSRTGDLTIREYFVSLDVIVRFQIFSFFSDAGIFYAVKGGPGKYVYRGDYHEDGSIKDFDIDAEEKFPFGLIFGLGKIFDIREEYLCLEPLLIMFPHPNYTK